MSRSPFIGYGPGPDPPKPEIDIDIDIENDLNIPDLENPNEDIDLGDGQVSCDWWRAGHVTTVLTLIGSPGVCSSPPTWPPEASTSQTLNTSSTIRS